MVSHFIRNLAHRSSRFPMFRASGRSLRLEQLEDRRLLHGSPNGDHVHGDDAPTQVHEYARDEVLVSFEGEVASLFLQQGADVALGRANRAVEVLGLHSPKVLMHLPAKPGRGSSLATRWALPPGSDVMAAVEQLGDVPGVAFAEPNFILTASLVPDDPRFDDLWGMDNTGQTGGTPGADIDAPQAWDVHTGTGSVVVGVIDSGVKMGHADLAANIWTNPGETAGDGIDNDANGYIDDVNGWDFVNNDNDPDDDFKHGTHVAGTIGAVGNNGVGVAGVNWNVEIMPLKFLDNQGSGSTANAILAMDYATNMRTRLVDPVDIVLTNNSWGGGAFSQALFDAIDASRQANMMFVAAAGNDGGAASFPAAYDLDNIVSVAATDHDDLLASFSNRGAGVDMAAPGVGIVSTMRNGYSSLDGTSMASPHVAGAASLLWDLAGPDTPYGTIRDLLYDNVDVLPALNGQVETSGRLNVFEAIKDIQMVVTSSTPAAGDVLGTQPVDFDIDFSFPASPVSTSDFLVNGSSPSSVVLSNGDLTATFTYSASPVMNEGPQTIRMTGGSVSTTTGLYNPALQDWTETFFYDTTPLTVMSTLPGNGQSVMLPAAQATVPLSVTFNEEIFVVNPPALILNRGTVDSAVVDPLFPKIVVYSLSVPNEEGTLTYEIPPGAVVDVQGNPTSNSILGSMNLDFDTSGFPVPLTEHAPAGAAIYHGAVSGFLPTGDTDSFTIDVDGDQAITVVVRPDTGLSAKVKLLGSGIVPDPEATSISLGEPAIIQSIDVPPVGESYTIEVAHVNGAGGYTLEVALNALADAEPNDASPQTVDPENFLTLGVSGMSRAATVGQVTRLLGPITIENESGDDFLSTQNDLRGSWGQDNANLNLWRINDGAGVTGNIGERFGPLGSDGQDTWFFTAQAGDAITVSSTKFSVDLHDASGDQLADSGQGGTITYSIGETADYWIHVYGGKGGYTLTADLTTTADLTISGDNEDQYNFQAAAGDALRLVADSSVAGRAVSLELVPPSGPALMATSTAAFDATLEHTATESGNYTVRITPTTETPIDAVVGYGLLVTKNTVLDAQRHDSTSNAQSLGSGDVTVLGKIGTVVGTVLWLGSTDEAWNDGVFDVTQVDLADWNPQLPLNYDAIYVDSNAGVPSGSQASAISTFVNAGGGLVTENGGSEGSADFSWVPNAGTGGFTSLDQNGDGTLLTPVGQSHPVTSGLVASGLSNWHNVFPVGGNMDVLAETTAGIPNILADEYNGGRLVYAGHDLDGHSGIPQSKQLIRQALDWSSQRGIESDFYSFDLSAGDTVDIEAMAIAAGTAQFENALLPSVRLDGPDGSIGPFISSLTHTAGAGGTYYVEVLSTDGAKGEYSLILSVSQTPGITVNPTSGLITTESGGMDTFEVVLNTQPTGDVMIGISSDNTGAGTVSPDSLTFTDLNWATPQTVTVTGVDDGNNADGNTPYIIVTAAAVSGDMNYNGVDAADVSVTNDDNDGPVSANMHVGDLDPSATLANRGKWNATVTITVHDDGDVAIADATVSGSWSAGTSGSSSCVTDVAGVCAITRNNVKKNSASVVFTVDDVIHATNTYAPGDNHDPDGDSNGTSITVGKPAALNVAVDANHEVRFGQVLSEETLGPIVVEAISLWSGTNIAPRSLEVLHAIDVRVADLDGTLLGGATPGVVLIDRNAAGYGWSTGPDANEQRLSSGVDLLSVVMHEFGHTLGLDHDRMGATLGVGVRDFDYLHDLGGDTGSWTRVRPWGDANGDGRFDRLDLIAVLQRDKYLASESADWSEGDWNDDGVFNQLDIVDALQLDSYQTGRTMDKVFESLGNRSELGA